MSFLIDMYSVNNLQSYLIFTYRAALFISLFLEKAFYMHLGKLWLLVWWFSHGLPLKQSMHNDNTTAVLVCHSEHFLSVPLWNSLLKASHTWRQSKVFCPYGCLCFCWLAAWLGIVALCDAMCLRYLSVCICVLQYSHCCCREVGGFVCVAWHVPHLTFVSL